MYLKIFSDLFPSTYMSNCINYFLLLEKKKKHIFSDLS